MARKSEEKIERHRRLMRERYQAGVKYEQLERVKGLVREVQSLSYEQAIDYVQAHYRVKEFKKGE